MPKIIKKSSNRKSATISSTKPRAKQKSKANLKATHQKKGIPLAAASAKFGKKTAATSPKSTKSGLAKKNPKIKTQSIKSVSGSKTATSKKQLTKKLPITSAKPKSKSNTLKPSAKSFSGAQASPKKTAKGTKLPNVKIIRENLNMTRREFSSTFHIRFHTIKQWEGGYREPRGAARIYLTLIAKKPEVIRNILAEIAQDPIFINSFF